MWVLAGGGHKSALERGGSFTSEGGLDYGCLQVDVHSAAQMWWQNAGEIRRLVLVLLPAVVWWWVLVGSERAGW